MTPIELTDEQVRETLRKAVEERPNYVYSCPEYMAKPHAMLSCFYVHNDEDGEPVSAGCGVGVVLNRLGVPLSELIEHEGRSVHQMIHKVTSGLSPRVVSELALFQDIQDNEKTWGEAYLRATGESL